ncbi:hypothetical protein C9374_005002 [Naegleria lovaniensis]|uniref:Cyanocobalamin reductase (cyanide-eliminating) n=1 Tax=Naegleria lovaniensis TaxID=51637 RepID=A0AA88GMG6_NAELO|nr:uncharacterized protein C9374_005002 [Naegleria lovaniensis]KAG2383035.1 hypothetical protein C9374_005002 [Naegleria lovaniensis]
MSNCKNSFIVPNLKRIQQSLKDKGFEIFQPFPISRYHDYYLKSRDYSETIHLNPYEKLSSDDCLAVLIGNTKSLWPHFTSHTKTLEKIAKNPLDQYVVESVNSVLQQEFLEHHPTTSYSVYYSHEFEGNYPRVAIQVAGQVSGVAYYENEVSYLSFHPQYGPWFAFRAVVCFNHVKNELLEEYAPLFKHPLNSMLQLLKDVYHFDHNHMSEQFLEDLITRLKIQLKIQLNIAMNSKDAQHEWIKLRDIPHEFLEKETNIVLRNTGQQWKQTRYDTSQVIIHYERVLIILGNHAFYELLENNKLLNPFLTRTRTHFHRTRALKNQKHIILMNFYSRNTLGYPPNSVDRLYGCLSRSGKIKFLYTHQIPKTNNSCKYQGGGRRKYRKADIGSKDLQQNGAHHLYYFPKYNSVKSLERLEYFDEIRANRMEMDRNMKNDDRPRHARNHKKWHRNHPQDGFYQLRESFVSSTTLDE